MTARQFLDRRKLRRLPNLREAQLAAQLAEARHAVAKAEGELTKARAQADVPDELLSRREAQSYGAGAGVNVTIMARDAESFRQSRTQVAADIARAVSLGRRGM